MQEAVWTELGNLLDMNKENSEIIHIADLIVREEELSKRREKKRAFSVNEFGLGVFLEGRLSKQLGDLGKDMTDFSSAHCLVLFDLLGVLALCF